MRLSFLIKPTGPRVRKILLLKVRCYNIWTQVMDANVCVTNRYDYTVENRMRGEVDKLQDHFEFTKYYSVLYFNKFTILTLAFIRLC